MKMYRMWAFKRPASFRPVTSKIRRIKCPDKFLYNEHHERLLLLWDDWVIKFANRSYIGILCGLCPVYHEACSVDQVYRITKLWVNERLQTSDHSIFINLLQTALSSVIGNDNNNKHRRTVVMVTFWIWWNWWSKRFFIMQLKHM